MKKINIAELLKDCPKGMELDCTMYNEVCLFNVDDNENITFPIRVIREDGNSITLTKYGQCTDADFAKCVIFPKGKTTWEGFVPPCKFKDGDIITDSLGTCIFKGEGKFEGTVDYYCGISNEDTFSVKDNKLRPNGHYGFIVNYRLATEEEKQKLFQAIKDKGYKWNTETKTLEKLPKFKVGDRVKTIYGDFQYDIKELTDTHYTLVEVEYKYEYTEPIIEDKNWELVPNKFDITTLVPFDKVLARCSSLEKWHIQLFEKYDKTCKYPFICMGYNVNKYKECIPYEQNEHLLDTTDDCDEYYKTW